MNLYKLSQDVNINYDTFDSLIVCAESESEAIKINPSTNKFDTDEIDSNDEWIGLKDIKIIKIGIANKEIEKGIVLSSYNAG